MCIFLAYPSYTEIQQIWSYIDIEITSLKELLVTLEIKITHRVQDIVSMWYVTAQQLCVVAHGPVNIWHCSLSSKNCHITILCPHAILVPFREYLRSLKYYFDAGKIKNNTSTFKKWRIVSLYHPHWQISRTSVSSV